MAIKTLLTLCYICGDFEIKQYQSTGFVKKYTLHTLIRTNGGFLTKFEMFVMFRKGIMRRNKICRIYNIERAKISFNRMLFWQDITLKI